MGHSWALLGRSWAGLLRILDGLVVLITSLGALLVHPWNVFGLLWDCLGRSGDALGHTWGNPGALLGRSEGALGRYGALFGVLGFVLGSLGLMLMISLIFLPAFFMYFGGFAFVCLLAGAVGWTLSHMPYHSPVTQAFLHMLGGSVYLPVGHSGTCYRHFDLEYRSPSCFQTPGLDPVSKHM